MEKAKTVIIFALSLTVAYGVGFCHATTIGLSALKESGERRSRRTYRSYSNYQRDEA